MLVPQSKLKADTVEPENMLHMQAGCTFTCGKVKREILQDVVCMTPEQLAAIERDRQICFAERESYASDAELLAELYAGVVQQVEDLYRLVQTLQDQAHEYRLSLAKKDTRAWIIGVSTFAAGSILGGVVTGLAVHNYDKSHP